MGFISANVGRLMGSTSTALAGAQALLAGEAQGLAFDFTDQSALIIDTGTPANNYSSTGIVSSGSLVGPSGKLTYTSPSNKLTMQSDGFIKYQAHNLGLNSEELDLGATWPTVNATVTGNLVADIPSGYAEYNKVIPTAAATTAQVNQIMAETVGAQYSVTYVCKAAEYDQVKVSDDSRGCYFNLTAGTKGAEDSGISGTMTSLGGGWYACTIEYVAIAASRRQRCEVAENGSTTLSTAGDGSSGVLVTGFHFRRTPSLTDYIATTSAAKYALPLEYDTSGNCLGLLVEEARTNLCLQSADFATTWTTTECTVSANAATAPNGLTHADKLVPSTNNAAHYVNQSITFTAAAYAFSAYCKASGYDYIQIFDSVAGTAYANFNLSAGTVGNTSDYTASIESVGNGWYRVCVVFTMTASARTMRFCPINADTASRAPAFAGDGTSGVLIWGAQAELGSFPTSPIITYGATATRAADNISIATSLTPYSATENTILMSFTDDKNLGSNNPWLEISPASRANGLTQIYTSSGSITARYYGPSFASQCLFTDAYASETAITKVGISLKANLFDCSINGSTETQDTSGTYQTNADTNIALGNQSGGSVQCNGIIRYLCIKPRTSSATELQAETA